MSEDWENRDSAVLEEGTVGSLRFIKEKVDDWLLYRWRQYFELARQRSQIQDKISKVLQESSRRNYKFQHMQRAVKYKYGLHPLSTVGSLNYIGGRFNTGAGVNSEIPYFPALYLANDKDTALQEHLGQEIKSSASQLSSRELALTNPSSETIVSVSGQLDMVFDLTQVDNLKNFVSLLENFTFSEELISLGKTLNIPENSVIKTPQALLNSLLDPGWREFPVNSDVPSNSQVFGHMVYLAGIEGILYPSKFTNQLCIAVFPHNFSKTDSYIYMDDEVPHKSVPKRIDGNNWRICDLNFNEIDQHSLVH